MTLDIAYKKALVILRLPLSVYLKREGSITLEDVTCAGIIVREPWKSEDVAQALHGLLENEPHLRAVMKDAGYDLAKGVRLWKAEAKRKDIAVISDISHEASNALKDDFKNKKSFQLLKQGKPLISPLSSLMTRGFIQIPKNRQLFRLKPKVLDL